MPALTVKDFRSEIVAVAKAESRELGGFSGLSQLLALAGFFVGIVYTISNPRWIGNPLYHGLGFAIALAGVLIVRYVIDPRIVVCSMDERFSEYGLLCSFRYECVSAEKRGALGLDVECEACGKDIVLGNFAPLRYQHSCDDAFRILGIKKNDQNHEEVLPGRR